MKPLFFEQTTIIDPNGPHHLEKVDLLVVGGVIQKIASRISRGEVPEAAERCAGGHLSIGWTDLRVHLTDPGHEYKEDLASLATAARRGGFTRILALPNTSPVADNSGQIRSILLRGLQLPVRLLLAGALSKGAKGQDLAELYDMRQAGASAFTDGIHPAASTSLLLRGLQYLKPFDGLLMDFPLDMALAATAHVAEGVSAARMGLKGLPALAESLAVDRDLQALDYFPGKLHLGPISSAATIDRISAVKPRHEGLSAETSAAYLLLAEEDTESFDANTKLWPPLRSQSDRKALCRALQSGVIDAISSGHQPQSTEEKKHDFVSAKAGASTIELAFSAAWTGFRGEGGDLSRLVESLSAGPMRILGMEAPHIAAAAETDLTWFDPDSTWTPSPSDLHSKSKYSPFTGRSLQGRVLGSLCRSDWQRL